MTARTRLTWLLRWLVSAGLLAWILTRPELGQFGTELRRMNMAWLLAGLLCAALALALGAWRWQACLQALGLHLPLAQVFQISLAAAAAGCFSFGALGTDLAKVVLAGRQLGGRHGGILSSLALDHASAIPCVVLMVALAVRAHGTIPEFHSPAVGIVLTLGAVMLAALALVAWRFKRMQVEFLRVLADRATWHGFWIAVWRSLPMWLAYCGIFYCAARAFGVVVPVAGFAGVIAIADGVASLPVTIAGLGVREQAFQSLLSNWYGVAPASAVALSLTGFSLSLVWAAVGALCVGAPVKTAQAVIS
jgi:uncharacterized membrane protein YbhN (UPF0104 family)